VKLLLPIHADDSRWLKDIVELGTLFGSVRYPQRGFLIKLEGNAAV
jgi:hypothetical protein